MGDRKTVDDALLAHEVHLYDILMQMRRVAVAFSGGVDSTYILAVAIEALGPERVLALTAHSPMWTEEELSNARALAASLGARHVVFPFDELAVANVAANGPRRCYYCKQVRFQALLDWLTAHEPAAVLAHGENADDHLDYRPGSVAAQELGVRAPLAEAGLTKAMIRALSQRRRLPTWDRPAAPCLATRFPTDTPLTAEGLKRVAAAERAMAELTGLRVYRVRDHYPVARLEVPAEEIARLAAEPLRSALAERLRALGYRHIALDLDGYRMGSMNRV
jgi:uncharacterized protein